MAILDQPSAASQSANRAANLVRANLRQVFGAKLVQASLDAILKNRDPRATPAAVLAALGNDAAEAVRLLGIFSAACNQALPGSVAGAIPATPNADGTVTLAAAAPAVAPPAAPPIAAPVTA
jgi:hypothetical protein